MSDLEPFKRPPPLWWRLGPALWVSCLVVLLGTYLFLNLPGSWFGGGSPQIYPGAAMGIAAGHGQTEGTRLVITSPDSKNATIVALLTPKVSTREYGLIAVDVEGMPDHAEVTLFWRNDLAPGKMFTRSLAVAGGRVQDAMVAGDSNWLGKVSTVGLIVKGALPQPLSINNVALRPATAATIIRERFADWFDRETWTGISLARIVGGRAAMDLPLPLLTGLATALAGAVYWLLHHWCRWTFSWLTIAAIIMSGWFALDLRWQWNLAANAAETWSTFAGKDLSQKRLAGIDAELEKVAGDVRPLLPRGTRLFLVAQDPVATGRLAYLLLPARVHYDIQQGALPPADRFVAGDLLLIYRKSGIRYSPERKEFVWNEGNRLRADIIHARQGSFALARVL